jgi:hypothetical protein
MGDDYSINCERCGHEISDSDKKDSYKGYCCHCYIMVLESDNESLQFELNKEKLTFGNLYAVNLMKRITDNLILIQKIKEEDLC